MITRAQMRRQLRAQGGIMNVTSRKKYGIGSDFKDFVRKLIPNEIADVAVKAAPFVAPFNPGIAGLMRGIGRFDQRGSISDALKQGAATFGFGKAAGFLGGAEGPGGMFGKQTFTEKGFRQGPVGKRLFKEAPTLTEGDPNFTGGDSNKGKIIKDLSTPETKGLNVVKEGVDFVKEKLPILENLPDDVAQKLLVGSVTSGASALYSYFTGEFEPQQPGESYGEYIARRNTRVKQQMRGYMDSYYTPLRNPQYASLTSEQRDDFIDNLVGQTELEGTTDYQGETKATGGRVGLMGGAMRTGIMRTNKAGVIERDYRDKGGFVPVGIKEKADDVPAMLSKNEFVFTADAVRGAGNGSIEKGAQKMYNTMKNLEKRVV